MQPLFFSFLLSALLLANGNLQGQNFYLFFIEHNDIFSRYHFKNNYIFSKTSYKMFYTSDKTITIGKRVGGGIGGLLDYEHWRVGTSWLTLVSIIGNEDNGFEDNDYFDKIKSYEASIPIFINYKLFHKYRNYETPYITTGIAFNFYYYNNFLEVMPDLYGILYSGQGHYWTASLGIGYTIGEASVEASISKRMNFQPYQIEAGILQLSASVTYMAPTRKSRIKKDKHFYN